MSARCVPRFAFAYMNAEHAKIDFEMNENADKRQRVVNERK